MKLTLLVIGQRALGVDRAAKAMNWTYPVRGAGSVLVTGVIRGMPTGVFGVKLGRHSRRWISKGF
ncbi:MAG TPA: hypothetical protein PK309_07720 [Bacillota bacterium]|nr:hypothetical protein [Bacillota bacterium]